MAERTNEVLAWLKEEATEAYTEYFQNEFWHSPTLGQELVLMTDETAIAALMDWQDQHLFAWPTDTHPNADFCLLFFHSVDWPRVLTDLRTFIKTEKNNA